MFYSIMLLVMSGDRDDVDSNSVETMNGGLDVDLESEGIILNTYVWILCACLFTYYLDNICL